MTQQLPTQQGLLDMLQSDHERYQKLIDHLSEEEQQASFTPEGWSVKDFLFHHFVRFYLLWTICEKKSTIKYIQ